MYNASLNEQSVVVSPEPAYIKYEVKEDLGPKIPKSIEGTTKLNINCTVSWMYQTDEHTCKIKLYVQCICNMPQCFITYRVCCMLLHGP